MKLLSPTFDTVSSWGSAQDSLTFFHNIRHYEICALLCILLLPINIVWPLPTTIHSVCYKSHYLSLYNLPDWNMISCICNKTAQKLKIHSCFWSCQQYSRFIPKGSHRHIICKFTKKLIIGTEVIYMVLSLLLKIPSIVLVLSCYV